MSIWRELQRRKVLRVAAAYVVISWLLIQVGVTLEETLELPGWFDKFILAALMLGFPVALVLSWAYDIHPDTSQPASPSSNVRAVFIVSTLAILLVASAYSVYLFKDVGIVPRPAEQARRIAVLPFADMSPDADQAWFADGISDEILNVLAKTEGLRVASRTASFRYRGEKADVKAVASELGVQTILEGSVRTQGNQIRITAQLVDADSGFHLWSSTYDRQLSDVFLVQDEIATSIATALLGQLGIQALPAGRFEGTRNIEAYTHYLKGVDKLNNPDLRIRLSAQADLQRAVELDPDFANAWARLANVESYVALAEYKSPSVTPSLHRALSLDPNNINAVLTVAAISVDEGDWLAAEQLFLRAITVDPDNPRVHLLFGNFLRRTGRVRRALEQFEQARVLGSEHTDIVSRIINTHNYLGEFAEARAKFEETLAEVGIANMRGTEAYFVALLIDGMENEARAFADQELPGPIARMRIRFFLDRIDGEPEAGDRLAAATLDRINARSLATASDIENLVMAGKLDLARETARTSYGFHVGVPWRTYLYVSDEVDTRYLPYRPNLLLIADTFSKVLPWFEKIGFDIESRAREKGYIN